MNKTSLRLGIPLLACCAVFGNVDVAAAQPGMTPPGSTPPYTAPPPASPGPAGEPATAPSQEPYAGDTSQDPYSQDPYSQDPYSQDPYSQDPSPQSPKPYYGPPMPPPAPVSQDRSGFHFGVSAGLGAMESDVEQFNCSGCEPVAVTFDVHAGKMLSPKFGLQGEVWFQVQNLDDSGSASISQAMFSLAAQYWLHPRVWVKAGIGFANLSLNYDSGFGNETESLGNGSAIHGGVGVELIQSQNFALDLVLKTGAAGYEERNETVSATSLGFGVNWY